MPKLPLKRGCPAGNVRNAGAPGAADVLVRYVHGTQQMKAQVSLCLQGAGHPATTVTAASFRT